MLNAKRTSGSQARHGKPNHCSAASCVVRRASSASRRTERRDELNWTELNWTKPKAEQSRTLICAPRLSCCCCCCCCYCLLPNWRLALLCWRLGIKAAVASDAVQHSACGRRRAHNTQHIFQIVSRIHREKERGRKERDSWERARRNVFKPNRQSRRQLHKKARAKAKAAALFERVQ